VVITAINITAKISRKLIRNNLRATRLSFITHVESLYWLGSSTSPPSGTSVGYAYVFSAFWYVCMSRPSFFFLALVFCVTGVQAQNAVLRGYITDEADGQPLQGVNVVLTSDAGAFLGAASDRDGLFAISGISPGRYYLEASYVGYQTLRDTLDLAPDEIRPYNFALSSGVELEELMVEAERETAGAAAITAGLQTVRARDIELIPAPDLSGDLASYLATMPGVVASGDQGGQLFIRGGEPTQNQVLLDGILIYQPFHLIGFYSAIPSAILNVSDVYAGGFGAKYGGRLSSVIDISTRNGNKRRFSGEFSAAPFISAGLLEGPLVRDKVSFLMSGRFDVIDQGASRIIDTQLPYSFNDQFLKIHAITTENTQLSVTGLRSFDRGILGAVTAAEADSIKNQVEWLNNAIGGRFTLLPTRIPVQAEILVSFSSIENSHGPAEAPTRSSKAQEISSAVNVTHFAGFTDISWGMFFKFNQLDNSLAGIFQNLSEETEFVSEAGGYIRTDIPLLEDSPFELDVEPGIRFSSFPSKGRNFAEPRLRAILSYGIHRVSAAAGIYHQEFVGLADRRDAGDVFTAWTSSPTGSVPRAIHFLGGYQIRPTSWLRIGVEGFYKDLSNLSVAEWVAFPRFTVRLQPAEGTVRGGDARIEIDAGPFYGFVNYGYAEVEYTAQQQELASWFGSDSYAYSPPHDRRHQVNAVGSFNFRSFSLSARWQYGSGLPFSEALGFDEFVLLDGPKDLFKDPGETRVLYSFPYGGRLPDYHRLDVSAEYSFEFTDNVALTVLASGTNTYDRTNLFYIDLFTLNRLDQLPFIPAAGLKLEF